MLALTLAWFVVVGAVAAEATPTELRFEPLLASYGTVAEIHPTLMNSGTRSLYLARVYPLSAAFLERWNDVLGTWQSGKEPIHCGTVADPEKPIELKPGNRFAVTVWGDPIERRAEGMVFTLGSFESQPLPGKYRLVMSYAISPWTVSTHPAEIRKVVSSPFEVRGDARESDGK